MKPPLLLRNLQAGPDRARESLPIEIRALQNISHYDDCIDRELLVIEGGDGTVQRVLTQLLRIVPDGILPPIAILPAGTTNMSCADFNRAKHYREGITSLQALTAGRTPEVALRRVVRVQAGAEVNYGFCFCLGVIVDAVKQFAKARSGKQLIDNIAMAAVVAKCLVRTHTSVVVQSGQDRIETFAMVATTLDRLLYGMRPWADGSLIDGVNTAEPDSVPVALHATWIESGAAGLWRRLPAFMRGDPALFSRPGYRSTNVTGLNLGFSGPFVMDGEMFANPDAGVRVTPGPALRFVVL